MSSWPTSTGRGPTGPEGRLARLFGRRSAALALALTLALPLAAAPSGATQESPADLGALEAEVGRILETTGVPGAAVALVSRQKVLWLAGVGWADREERIPVTPDILFRQGSISKTIVALAALVLEERGLLRLDHRLRDLLPEAEFKNPWEDRDPLRLVHLLEHTAGFDDLHLAEYAWDRPEPLSLAEALAFHPDSRISRWPPGRYAAYSNAGPALAADAVERTSGRPFEEWVAEEIFAPLGMETATFQPPQGSGVLLAQGYDGRTGALVPYRHFLFGPSGGLHASAREMARFVRFLLGRGELDGRRLLSPGSLARMETPVSTLAAEKGLRAGYGLGSYTSFHGGFVFHGHAGGIGAFIAEYGYLPDEGLGYALMLNSDHYGAYENLQGLVRSFLTRGLPPPVPPPPAPLPPGRLDRLAGFYAEITPRHELLRFLMRLLGVVRVKAVEEGLEVRRLGREAETLLPVTAVHFRRENEPLATFAFLDEGRGILLQASGGPLQGTYRRIPVWSVTLRWGIAGAALVLQFSSLVSALAWASRWLVRRTPIEGLGLRLLPLSASLAFFAAAALPILGAGDFIARFGRPTPWSVSLGLLLWLYPALTGAAALEVLRQGRAVRAGPRRPLLYAAAVTTANLVVAAYLAWCGLLGLQTWSY